MGAEDKAAGAGVRNDFSDNIGNEAVSDGDGAVDALLADAAGESFEHEARVAIEAQRIVVRDGTGFHGDGFMRQDGVHEDERGAAGFCLREGMWKKVIRIRKVGRDDDSARRGKRGRNGIMREGHGVLLTAWRALADPSFVWR